MLIEVLLKVGEWTSKGIYTDGHQLRNFVERQRSLSKEYSVSDTTEWYDDEESHRVT
jgi:hypothetical protein